VALYGGVVYPTTHSPVNPVVDVPRRDLCGGTGGTGQIVSVDGPHDDDQSEQTVWFQTLTVTDRTTIRTSDGPASVSDLKVGDRVTVVVYDGKTATTVLICTISVIMEPVRSTSQRYGSERQ